MESLESLNLQLAKHEESRRLVSAALLKANEQLVTAKVGQRGRLRDSIKNYEQELKRLDRLIKDVGNNIAKLEKSQDKMEIKTTAYEQGIDPNKAWADAISSGLGSVTNAITAIVNPLSGAKTPSNSPSEYKKVLEGSEPNVPAPPGYLENDPFAGGPSARKASDWYLVYILGGLAVLYFIFKSFKK